MNNVMKIVSRRIQNPDGFSQHPFAFSNTEIAVILSIAGVAGLITVLGRNRVNQDGVIFNLAHLATPWS